MNLKIKITIAALIAGSAMTVPLPVAAQTGDSNYLGEIANFGFNFCPRGWAATAGQPLNIAQNAALFSLLGTTYGGDGSTTFALPDLRGRVPVGSGNGPGLDLYTLGQVGGTENVTLNVNQMAQHNHNVLIRVSSAAGAVNTPVRNTLASSPASQTKFATSASATNFMDAQSIKLASTGSGQPFNALSPYLTTTYCIALTGAFPSRS